jgi:2-C-methyl-D-erythritol 4-phosphate cytidylyltransferase
LEVWAIVVAAGSGTRFGRRKQYASLAGRRVLDWAVDAARGACDGVIVVLPAADVGTADVPGADTVVAGAGSRSGSVRAGLAAVPASADVIVVHDAVRPLAGPKLWNAVLEAVAGGVDAAIPGVSVTDTIKRVTASGEVIETLDRRQLVSVQTPQAFLAPALRAAHAALSDATDDAALIEATGGRVSVVAGDPSNIKITEPIDLDRAAALLRLSDRSHPSETT